MITDSWMISSRCTKSKVALTTSLNLILNYGEEISFYFKRCFTLLVITIVANDDEMEFSAF